MARSTKYLRNRNGTWWIDVRIPAKSGLIFPGGRLRMSLRTTNLDAAARIRDQTIVPLLATTAKKEILEELVRQICRADDDARAHVANLSALCTVEQVAGIRSAVLSPVTVTKMIDEYLEYRTRTKSLKSGSLTKYESSRNIIVRMIGNKDAQTITTADLCAMRDELLTMPAAYFRRGPDRACKTPRENEKTISARTIFGHVNFLSSVYSWAIKQGRVVCANPTKGCEVKVKKSKQKAVPNVDEVQRLESIPRSDRSGSYSDLGWEAIPKILHYTGCRWSEAAGLRAEDVRKVDGIWCFDINHHNPSLKTTDSAVRLIPIASAILPYILDLRKKTKAGRLFTHIGDRYKGEKIGAGLNAKFNAAAKTVGPFSSHCFRMYVNNVFVRYGVDVIDRERLLGHKNSITQATYVVGEMARYKKHVELIETHEKRWQEEAADTRRELAEE